MRLLGKYFFSPKVDFFAFCSFIPIYFLYLFFFETKLFQLPDSPPFLFMLLGWLLVDGSHVFSMLLVSYADKDMHRQLKPLMWGVPIALIVSAFTLVYFKQGQYFYYFLAYLAMVHFIRQEFGWMKIASRFDSSAPKWLYNIDMGTSYAMTILPMIWFTRESQKAFWYQAGDMFATPQAIAEVAIKFYFPVVAIFLAANAWHAYKTKTFNLSKMLVFINTFFGWYMSKVHVQNPYLSLWLMIFHHGLPYYFIVFKTERVTQNLSWMKAIGKFKYPVMYAGSVAIFYLFMTGHSNNTFVWALKKDPFFKALIYGISVMPQMTHFILDGFIWKKKYGLVGGVGKKAGALPSTSAEAA